MNPTTDIVAKARTQIRDQGNPRTREFRMTMFEQELAELDACAAREGLSRMATARAAIVFYSRFFRDPGVRAAMRVAENR